MQLQPIGRITVFAIAEKGSYVTPGGARPGDDIILTKGPAIEATGILATLREEELLRKVPSDLVQRAKDLCWQTTVVKDAMAAMEAGGVTAMHDATEGGVIGALFEIANASSAGMRIGESLFIYPEEVKAVCGAFGIDPIVAIAEGTLLITASESSSPEILRRLKSGGIDASVVGKVLENPEVREMKRLDGSIVSLAIPEQDPFWPIAFEGLI